MSKENNIPELTFRDKLYRYRQVVKNYCKNIFTALFQPALLEKLSPVEELNKCVVLLYHRVTDLTSDPQLLSVKPSNFSKHLEILSKKYNVLTIDEFSHYLKNRINFPKNSVLITFDDGYADNFLEATPILEHYKKQALFYIATGTLNTETEYWWDAIERIILNSNNSPEVEYFEMNMKKYKIQNLSDSARIELYETLLRDMKVMRSESREMKIKELAELFNSTKGRNTHRGLTFDELKKMDQSESVVIGAHTHFHPCLAAQTFEDQFNEISTSKKILEELLGKKIEHFSYPFGGAVHYNQDTIAIVKELEFEFVAANIPTLMNAKSDRFQFPRFLVRDWEKEEFEHNLNQFFTNN